MTKELSEFRDAAASQVVSGPQVELDVLVIEQGDLLLGVLASAVDSIVPWQTPAPLPQSAHQVLGVIQDRGRLVAVHRYQGLEGTPRRLVVCTTTYGLIGLAVTGTRHVGTIVLQGELRVGVPLRTSAGDLTLLDPEELARRMIGTEDAQPGRPSP